MDVVDRAIVVESSRRPIKHMTTDASGTVTVEDAVAENGSTAVMAAVTSEGAPQVSPAPFVQSMTTA